MQNGNGHVQEQVLSDEALLKVKLSKDLRQSAKLMSQQEVRYLVDTYIFLQRMRIAQGNRVRDLSKGNEPHAVIDWLGGRFADLEAIARTSLDIFSYNHPVGQWMRNVHGCGPVIAAGFLAHIDIKRAPTVGHIWSFAGLTNDAVWLGGSASRQIINACIEDTKKPIGIPEFMRIAKAMGASPKWLARRVYRVLTDKEVPFLDFGKSLNDEDYVRIRLDGLTPTRDAILSAVTKRPFNAALKVLCWKLGDSFRKQSGNEKCLYGQMYKLQKAKYVAKNEAGGFAELAAHTLATRKFGKDTAALAAYSVGKLPPGRIDLMAMRYAVKQFLADLHAEWYRFEFGREPPAPYPIAILGHAHQRRAPSLADLAAE